MHGHDGPVKIGHFNYRSETAAAFVNASEKVGIPVKADFNDGKGTLGVNRVRVFSFCVLYGFFDTVLTDSYS